MHTRTFRAAVSACLLSGLLSPAISHAYQFMPTDLEWATWPEYCRARYVTTNIGRTTKGAREYPRASVEMWRMQLGDEAFLHVHHFCAGAAYLNRSKLEGNAQRRKLLLADAASEANYTFERAPKSSPVYANVAIHLGQVHKDLGKHDEAIGFIKQAMNAQPKDPRPYLGLAMLYRDMKRLDLARDALLSGDAALEGESVEIHYHLGLIYFDLKEMDAAVEYAKRAYGREYPLPGLQDKLRRAGRWPD